MASIRLNKSLVNFFFSGIFINAFSALINLILTALIYKNFTLTEIGSYFFITSTSLLISQICSVGIFDLLSAAKEEVEENFSSNNDFLCNFFIFYCLTCSFLIYIIFVVFIGEIEPVTIILAYSIIFYKFGNIVAKYNGDFWASEIYTKIAFPVTLILMILLQTMLGLVILAILPNIILGILMVKHLKKAHNISIALIKKCVSFAVKNYRFGLLNIIDNFNNNFPLMMLGLFSSKENVALWNLLIQIFRGLSIINEVADNQYRFRSRMSALGIHQLLKTVQLNSIFMTVFSAFGVGLFSIFDHLLFSFLDVEDKVRHHPIYVIYLFIFLFSSIKPFVLHDVFQSKQKYVLFLGGTRLFACTLIISLGLYFELNVVFVFAILLFSRVFMASLSVLRSYFFHANITSK